MRKGDSFKVNAWIKEYGYAFVVEAVEKAIDLKNAREMEYRPFSQVKSKKEAEARIINKAKEMGVRLK